MIWKNGRRRQAFSFYFPRAKELDTEVSVYGERKWGVKDGWSTFSEANHRTKESDFGQHRAVCSQISLDKAVSPNDYCIYIYAFTSRWK